MDRISLVSRVNRKGIQDTVWIENRRNYLNNPEKPFFSILCYEKRVEINGGTRVESRMSFMKKCFQNLTKVTLPITKRILNLWLYSSAIEYHRIDTTRVPGYKLSCTENLQQPSSLTSHLTAIHTDHMRACFSFKRPYITYDDIYWLKCCTNILKLNKYLRTWQF